MPHDLTPQPLTDQHHVPAAPPAEEGGTRTEPAPSTGSGRRPAPTAAAAGPAMFPDLSELPAELGLEVLKHLNATDLCLAACVWQNLAEDEILWQGCVPRRGWDWYGWVVWLGWTWR